MNLEIKHYQELSTDLLYDIIKARIAVFVVEQNCPYMECDDLDKQAYHCFVRNSQEIIAYTRVIPPGVQFAREASLGRVMTTQNIRRTGIGKEMFRLVLDFMLQEKKYQCIRIEAQQYLKEFYEKFDFQAVSDTFIIDGIEHLEMVYNQKG